MSSTAPLTATPERASAVQPSRPESPLLDRVAPFLPAAALLAIWVAWIPLDGGYFPRAWYPAAIFLVVLLAVVAAVTRRLRPLSRASQVALALLAAFTAWSFLSLLWAGSPGSGWAASDQLLLYLATAWLVALVPWRAAPATLVLGCWSIGAAIACAAELGSALGSQNLGHYLLEGRWQQPTGYANTAAALPAMACWPALMLASRRGVHPALQVVFLAVAVFLVEFSQLPQSRAALVVLAIALVVFVALSPDRPRVLLRLAIVGGALAIAGGAIWDVYGAWEAKRPVAPALDRAAQAMLLSLGITVLAGIAATIVERRVGPRPRAVAAARKGFLIGALVASLAAGVLAVANASAVSDYAADRWAQFKSNADPPKVRNDPTRIFQSVKDKRYDYWRVVVATLGEHPVGGVGAGGFEREYTRERRHLKASRSAHSIWMRALIETGAAGTSIFVAFVVLVAVALVRARRRLDHRGRAIVAASAAVTTYFVAHGSIDWLELMPALAAPAVALPFLALGVAAPTAPPAGARPGGRRLGLWLGAAGGAVLVAVALAALALPYLSGRYVDSGLQRWRADPAGANGDLRRAAALNPLAPEPRLAQATVELGRGRYSDARRAFEQALDVEDSWYPHFELALLDAREGRFARARLEIARAHALNPPDPLVTKAASLIAKRKRIDLRAVDRNKLELPLYKDPRHL